MILQTEYNHTCSLSFCFQVCVRLRWTPSELALCDMDIRHITHEEKEKQLHEQGAESILHPL